ncbi:MAG: TolC family protein [Candidatus Obscuribacterales bacterium]|nr:TolC family protein [Candidatus Obscuribacterales bacterium]
MEAKRIIFCILIAVGLCSLTASQRVVAADSRRIAESPASDNTSPLRESIPSANADATAPLRGAIPAPGDTRLRQGSASSAVTPNAFNKLDEIVNQAQESEGAMFIDQNKIQVKKPLLTALIKLNDDISPYGLDAIGEKSLTLRDVLTQELLNNLDIRISNSDYQTSKWNFRSSLGGFLPSLGNQLTYQGLTGKYASPFGLLTSIGSPYLTIPSALTWNFFDGGATIFGALQSNHQYKAAKYDLQRTTNDLLYEGARLYYQLVLQDVLLQIRIKAVETSEALVEKNRIQYQYGANTQLDVLQAETQLTKDRQALISQQIARRKAAVLLATNLNLNCEEDLLVTDRVVGSNRLVDESLKVHDLVQIAIDTRPELKKWEQLRLAAKDAIKVAYAPLIPSVVGSAGLSTTGALVASGGSASSASSSASTGSFGTGSFSSSSVSSVGGGGGSGKRFNLAEIYLIGVTVQWNIGGLGLTDTSKIQAARWQARKAQQEFARELTYVCKSVRDAYLDSLDAENLIAATSASVKSSREQLKVAVIRLEEGVGMDLDVVNAQREYTDALVSKAKAIVQFNQAQAELVRAMGRISVDALTSVSAIRR